MVVVHTHTAGITHVPRHCWDWGPVRVHPQCASEYASVGVVRSCRYMRGPSVALRNHIINQTNSIYSVSFGPGAMLGHAGPRGPAGSGRIRATLGPRLGHALATPPGSLNAIPSPMGLQASQDKLRHESQAIQVIKPSRQRQATAVRQSYFFLACGAQTDT